MRSLIDSPVLLHRNSTIRRQMLRVLGIPSLLLVGLLVLGVLYQAVAGAVDAFSLSTSGIDEAVVFRSHAIPKMVLAILAATFLLASFSPLFTTNPRNVSQVMGGTGIGGDISVLSSKMSSD